MRKTSNHNAASKSSIMQRDFKSPAMSSLTSSDARQNWGSGLVQRKAHWVGLATSMAILATVFSLVTDNATATRADAVTLIEAAENPVQDGLTRITLPLAIPGGSAIENAIDEERAQAKPHLEPQTSDIEWKTATVKSGDNLALIFAK